MEIKVSPLFSDRYINNSYIGKLDICSILKGYIKRILVLFKIKKYNVVIIEKELFPYFPSLFEYLLRKLSVKFITDYDDAIFHNYDLNKNLVVKLLFKNKIENVMKFSTCVIAGNSYLAKKAKISKSKRIEVIPTVIDLQRYEKTSTNHKVKKPTVIGWIGTPTTFVYLVSLTNVLKEILHLYDVEIHIIGVKGDLGISNGVRYIDWKESTEVENILNFDIGIMPLKDSNWERGKCSYKLIQYMACKLPIIASPVGMNLEVIENNVNGFLAKTDEEWVESFKTYLESPDLRKEHGENGYKLVKKKYCIQRTYKKMIEIINSISNYK